MQVSNQFNRFYHKAILVDFYTRCSVVKFPNWVDAETGEMFEFIKGVHFNDMDDLKQILKNLCALYPNEGNAKMSTNKLSNEQLMTFIEWIFRLASYNHIDMKVVTDEWNRLLYEAGIIK